MNRQISTPNNLEQEVSAQVSHILVSYLYKGQ